MTSLLIVGGRIVDPSQGLDRIGDLLIVDDKIDWLGDSGSATFQQGCTILSAKDMVVSPGFIDLHCHLREPGFEEKETIATGTQAAAKGGFTAICCMPNTNPPIDSPAIVEHVKSIAFIQGLVRVFPIGCITKGQQGEELVDMEGLAEVGVVAFSDDGRSVANDQLLRSALECSHLSARPIIEHCEDASISANGAMNKGNLALSLGFKGIPSAAEEVIVDRDIALAELTNTRLHIAHASTATTVEHIRRAKEKGIRVTAEVAPHHLTLTEQRVIDYGANAKVNPPLRTEKDTEALLQGLKEGVIDAIATDHAPHTTKDKACDFNTAAFGISGLETALGVLLALVHQGKLDLTTLISKLTIEPAMILPLPQELGTLKVGAPGDITVFDPNREWAVDTDSFASKGKNTPWAGCQLKGKVMMTVVEGRVVYKDKAMKMEMR